MKAKKFLSLLLVLAMCFSLLPMGALAGDTYNATTANILTKIEQATAEDVVMLQEDIDLLSIDGMSITINKAVTIDLNGHKISGARAVGSNAAPDAAIKVGSGGVLTLKDSAGGGSISGNSTQYGAVWLTGGTLNLESGSITGNTAVNSKYNCAIDIFQKGTLNVTGSATVGNVWLSKNETIDFSDAGALGETTVYTTDKEYPVTIATGFAEGAASFINGNGDNAEVIVNGTDAMHTVPYTLTFTPGDANAEDVSNMPEDTTAYVGVTVPDLTPPLPERVGYNFLGFFRGSKEYYDADGAGKAQLDSTNYPTLPVDAKWQPIMFWLRGHYTDGTIVNWGPTSVADEKLDFSTGDTMKGKTLVGWQTENGEFTVPNMPGEDSPAMTKSTSLRTRSATTPTNWRLS
ncbi:MAG: hypothetical protein IJG63_08225 [Oscillospiraceae bacterium]|nr:hypothetical protein [Oscillospiraceae bacterium]